MMSRTQPLAYNLGGFHMKAGHMCASILFGATFVLDLGGIPVFGQTKDDSVAERRWSLAVSVGVTSRGPESGIENAMNASGFNQTSPADWSGGSQDHPFSRGGSETPWEVALRFALDPPIQVGIIVNDAANGEIIGYRQQMYLFVNYSILTIGTDAYIQVFGFRLGIGPALSKVKSWLDDAAKSVGASSVTKLGALIDVGLSQPADTRFFFDLDFQYCFTGKVAIGPYTSNYFDSSATMPSSRINCNYYVIAFGLGIRF
jgi:hypothetical protein